MAKKNPAHPCAEKMHVCAKRLPTPPLPRPQKSKGSILKFSILPAFSLRLYDCMYYVTFFNTYIAVVIF